jgi:hypothetical protein
MKIESLIKGVMVLCLAGMPSPATAQFTMPSQATRDSLAKLTNADHQKMMEALNITSLRPGRNGMDPTHPRYANYDESKANPYPNLPEVLILKNGEKVTTAQMWWEKRRPEIVEDFDCEVYGRVPKNMPKVKWVLKGTSEQTVGGKKMITKELEGQVDNSSYPQISVNILLNVSTPGEAAGPVPIVMEFGFIAPAGAVSARPAVANRQGQAAMKTWQEMAVEKGWGYATISPASIQADNGAGLTRGIIGLMNKGQYRKPEDWGSLRAWAWGASRAIDYLETDRNVNAKKIALEGHSRYGKATLITMAYEPRLAIAFVSSSGEGGASLYRRDWGEIIENLTSTEEYHWMSGTFMKYGGPLTWNDLPVDSHELIAMCAPRPVFISGGNKGDEWVDSKGMFMAAAAAAPVYTLLGKKDMGTDQYPGIEKGLMDGDLAFRQHNEGHTPGPNWPFFLDFAERYFK